MSKTSCQPTISPTARIARNAIVIDNVELGDEACVLFNATLRGDCNGRIVVGARSNIQELACVHVPVGGETIIGNDVTVGHGAILHGCTIGDGSLVGMGAVIIDGARIGKCCLIGAGALVTGTMDAPDGVLLLGSPARVVRSLTDEELAGLKESVDEYLRISEELAHRGVLTQGFATNGR